MENKLKVAVIGAGGIATAMHAPAWAANHEAVMTAVCDVIPEKAEKFAEKYGISHGPLRLGASSRYTGQGRLVYDKGAVRRRTAYRFRRSFYRRRDLADGQPEADCCVGGRLYEIC
jgi:hypothetical protein